MSKQEIVEFCELFDACDEGREWALEYCDSLADAWAKAPHDYLIWIATRPGVLTDCELRLFACWCVRQVWHLLTDPRSKQAVEVAERHAVGEATDEELSAAWSAARSAAWSAAWSAARSAARPSARYAARSAARSAAWSSAMSSAWYDAWYAQDAYLREQCKPDFARATAVAKEVA